MKIAVCVSGRFHPCAPDSIPRMKRAFNGDVFALTWESGKCYASKELNCVHVPEPEITQHPLVSATPPDHSKYANVRNRVLNGDTNLRERILHQTKQIIGHAILVDSLPEEYDMIVRCRFDSWVSKNYNFIPNLIESYKKNCAIGFAGITGDTIDNVKPVNKPQHKNNYLVDHIIMHPRKLLSVENVMKLHEDGQLLHAEYGWYQVLSKPHESNHLCFYGGAHSWPHIFGQDLL